MKAPAENDSLHVDSASDDGDDGDDVSMVLRMRMTVLLPHRVFLERTNVSRMVIETYNGSYGLLPRRLDCACALTRGIVVYESDGEGERYVAIDEGVLTKAGLEVRVAVRRATAGESLNHLRDAVTAASQHDDDEANSVRQVMNRLEGSFMQRLVAMHHG